MRAWKTDNTGTTYYLYGDNSTTPVCELNSSGSLTATNTYTINGITSRNAAGASTSYQFDQQGNVAERLNFSGSNTSSSTTDAFGNMTSSATSSDPFGYIGQAGYYTDLSTGLILTTFRYYDPSNGRFVNRDPSGYQGGIDLYNYTQNNAVNRLDPLGYGATVWGNHGHRDKCKCDPPPTWAAIIVEGIVTTLVTAALTIIGAYIPGILAMTWYQCLVGALAAAAGLLIYDIMEDCGKGLTRNELQDLAATALVGCGSGLSVGLISSIGNSGVTTTGGDDGGQLRFDF